VAIANTTPPYTSMTYTLSVSGLSIVVQ